MPKKKAEKKKSSVKETIKEKKDEIKVSIKEKVQKVAEKIVDRKDTMRKKFLEALKENHPDKKFDSMKYLDNTGAHGILRDAMGNSRS